MEGKRVLDTIASCRQDVTWQLLCNPKKQRFAYASSTKLRGCGRRDGGAEADLLLLGAGLEVCKLLLLLHLLVLLRLGRERPRLGVAQIVTSQHAV